MPIPKMIDFLIRKQSYLIQGFSKILLLTPIDIPIITLRLFVPPRLKCIFDTVGKIGFVFDLGA
jgi:hypothetical protein